MRFKHSNNADQCSFYSDFMPFTQVQPCHDRRLATVAGCTSGFDIALAQEEDHYAQCLDLFYPYTDTAVVNNTITGPPRSAFSNETNTNGWFAQGDNMPFSPYYHTPDAPWPSSHQKSDTVLASPQSIVSTTDFSEHEHVVDRIYNYELPTDLNVGTVGVTSNHSTPTQVADSTTALGVFKTGISPARKNSPEIIGSLLSNGRFKCTEGACARKTFGRVTELRRHITTTHAADKPQFWCHVPSCARSSKKPFSREDKLASHIRSMHED